MSFNDPEILQDFLTESGELLEELDADLVTLEDSADDSELLNKVFRALHTIKGSASFLGMANLVAIAHVAEDALNGARKGEVTIDKPFIDAVLEAVDILKGQFVELQNGQDLTAPPEALVQTLAAIAKGSGAAPAKSAEPEPVVEVAAVQASTPAPTGDDEWPRRVVMELTSGKSELIDFMVSDLEESMTSLQENLPKLGVPTSQQDSALELAELTEGVSRTIEFFEFAQMGTLVDTINLVAEHTNELNDAAMAQTMPRLLAIAQLMVEQTSGLKIGEIVTFEIDELCARVADVVLGHDLAADMQVSEAASIEEVYRIDNVLGAISAGEAASDQPQTTETPNAAPGDTSPADDVEPDANAGADADADASSNNSSNASAAQAAAAPLAKVEQTIRVEVGRLESLLNLVGELVIQKNRVGALSRSIVSTDAIEQDMREAIMQGSSDLDRITGDIQVAVMRTRMQPLDKIFGKYPRLIRDLSRKTGKEMQLVVEGGDVEVDKSVIEELGDPLVHLMRNSADHGIESPEDREAAGKDKKGTIRLVAVHEGSHVVIQMIDDGAGLNREKLVQIAIKRGLTTEDDAALLSDREVYRFIMAAGFSTAAKVSDISGRGVGMDVVRTNIERLKGTIDVDSVPGKGTTITIKIPLTVAIMPAMMVGVGPEQYAIPLSSILEIVMPEDQQVSTVHGRRVMRLRDAVLPLVSISDLFDVPASKRSDGKFAVVVELNDQTAGLMVEELIGQQEVVVKPLDDDIAGDGVLSGATVRDDGGVSLIVDIGRLIASAAQHEGALAA